MLRFLGLLAQSLQGDSITPQIDSVSGLEALGELFDQRVVDILAAEVGVAARRHDLEHAVGDLEDRDVEGASTEVVDRDALAFFLLEAIRQRGRRGLVDDALHLEPGDLARGCRGGSLRVVEVRGDGDHCLGYGLVTTEVLLGNTSHLLENHRGDFGGRVILARHVHPCVTVRVLDDAVRDEPLLALDLFGLELLAP